MPRLVFPTKRFQHVGATPEEIDELRGKFLRSDAGAQRFLLDRYGSIGDADIREELEDLREAGHFTGERLVTEEQAVVPPPEPLVELAKQRKSAKAQSAKEPEEIEETVAETVDEAVAETPPADE
jgi:hypothetical protein